MNAPPRHLPPPIVIAQQAGRLAPLSFLGSDQNNNNRTQLPPPPPPVLRSPGHDRLTTGDRGHSTSSPPTASSASLHPHASSYHAHAATSPHSRREYHDDRRDYHDDRRDYHDDRRDYHDERRDYHDERREYPDERREFLDETENFTGDGPPKKKQKRNKPTLSCHECVERKTKVCSRRLSSDQFFNCFWLPKPGRKLTCDCLSVIAVALTVLPVSRTLYPRLLSPQADPETGIKRQTECRYAHVANLLEYVAFLPPSLTSPSNPGIEKLPDQLRPVVA